MLSFNIFSFLRIFFFIQNLDGGQKMRSWANGQIDHMSTLSRPRSIEAISNGTLTNNTRSCNAILSHESGLHEDSDFPPNYTKSLSRRKPIVWMRPHVSERSSSFFLLLNL